MEKEKEEDGFSIKGMELEFNNFNIFNLLIYSFLKHIRLNIN